MHFISKINFIWRLGPFVRGCVTGVVLLLRMLPSQVSAPHVVTALYCVATASLTTTMAAEAEKRTFNLPRGDAAETLKDFATAAGTPIVYLVDRIRGATTNSVSGELTPREALEQMLINTDLEAAQDPITGGLVVSRKLSTRKDPANHRQTTNPPKMKTSRNIIAIAVAWIASAVTGNAQITSAANASDSTSIKKSTGEVIVLSPFQVSSGQDEGYSARQTSLSTRSAKNILELPSSVVIINRDLLNDLNSNIQNALNYGVAGVNNNQRADEDRTIRGFRSYNTLRNGFTIRSYKKLPDYDIERIEVIKGPLNMILASSYVGGGVNTITKAPTPYLKSEASLSIGDHNNLKAVLNTSGPLARTKNMSVDYRLTLGGAKGGNEKPSFSIDQKFTGGSLRFTMPNNQILTVDYYHFIDNDYVYWEDFLDIGDTGTVSGKSQTLKVAKINVNSKPDFSVQNPNDISWKTNDTYLSVQYLAKILEGDARLSYSYHTNRDRELLLSGVVVQPDNYTVSRRFIDAWVEWEDSNIQFDYRLDLDFGSFKLENMAGFDVQKGYDRYEDTEPNMPMLDTRAANAAAIKNADKAYLKSLGLNANGHVIGGAYAEANSGENYSLYLQESIKLFNDKLILIGGIRHQNGGKSFSGSAFNGTSPQILTGGPKPSYDTSRFGVVYRVAPTVSVYAQQAVNVFPRTGVLRAPGTDGPTDIGENFKDQEGLVKEAGIKFDRQVTENLSASGSLVFFDQYLTNVRTLISGPITGVPYATASAKDQVKGLEVDFRLRYKTNAGVADVIVTIYDADGKTADNKMVNNHIEKRPSIFAKYTFTTGNLKGFTAGFGWLGEGSKRAGGNWYVTQKATMDLLARYAFTEKLSAQVNVHNLTNERNIQGIAGSGLVQVSDGTTSTLALNYKF